MQVKKVNLLLISLMTFALVMGNITHAFVEDGSPIVYTISDVDSIGEVLPGTIVNFTIVVKNLSNNSITNITIVQTIADSFQTDDIIMVKSPLGDFDGTPVNTSGDAIDLFNDI